MKPEFVGNPTCEQSHPVPLRIGTCGARLLAQKHGPKPTCARKLSNINVKTVMRNSHNLFRRVLELSRVGGCIKIARPIITSSTGASCPGNNLVLAKRALPVLTEK